MTDERDIQADLHRAEVDLEHKVGELKAVLEDKLETPKRVLHTVETSLAWVRAHALVIAGVAAGVVIGTGVLWWRVGRARAAHAQTRAT